MNSHSINTVTSDTERHDQARHAGYVIYNGVPESDHTSSFRSLPEDELVCCGTMSAVRRTFCLFLLFDLTLSFILWVIYTQLAGFNIEEAFTQEIAHYTFKKSMFDTVLCAAWRFGPLMLTYALFKSRRPWAVAVTTSLTCVFLLVKIFMFDFNEVKNNAMGYLLLVVSFIITWLETWLLDFKVLPEEQMTRERVFSSISERSPLLGRHYDQFAHDEFHSPIESPRDSDDEEGADFRSLPGTRGHSRTNSRGSSSLNLSLGSQEQDYLVKAEEIWDTNWEIACVDDNWKLETGKDLETGCVHIQNIPKIGKVFRLQGYIECSAKLLFQELTFNFENWSTWNPTVKETKVIQIVNDNTDIIYQVAAEAGGGVISSRDFVNLRHWGSRGEKLVSVGIGVTHPDVPETKDNVRGSNGPGVFIYEPVTQNRSVLKCFINTDLKGWIPQLVVDQAMANVLLEYLGYVRKRMLNLPTDTSSTFPQNHGDQLT